MELEKPKNSFTSTALREGSRLDHRALHQYRPLRVTFGPTYGENVVVHLGKTYVSASVSYDLVEPSHSSPSTGFFDISIAAKNPTRQHGGVHKSPKTMNAIRIALEQCVKMSGIVDVGSFVYIPGRVVGSLRVDVSILSDDGNLIDCCSVAAQAALRHFRFHEITCSERNEIVIHRDRDPVPFVGKSMPIVVTLGYAGGRTVVDPTMAEMAFLDGFLNICVSPSGQVTGIYKYGGQPVSAELLIECTNVAVVKGLKLVGFLDEMLEKDLRDRETQFRAKLENLKKSRQEGVPLSS